MQHLATLQAFPPPSLALTDDIAYDEAIAGHLKQLSRLLRECMPELVIHGPELLQVLLHMQRSTNGLPGIY